MTKKNRFVGSFQQDTIKLHNHTLRNNSVSFATRASGMGIQANSGQQIQWERPSFEVENFGGTETRPKNVTINYIIRCN